MSISQPDDPINTPRSVAKLLDSETTEDLSAEVQGRVPYQKPQRPGIPSTRSAEELKATLNDLQSVSLQYLRSVFSCL